MALCRFLDQEGRPQFAVYDSGRICSLAQLIGESISGDELFERGVDWVAQLPVPKEDQWQSAPQRLLPPVPSPEKVFCIGLNYRDHALESGAEIPTSPVVFSKFNSALIGHGDQIVLPRVSEQVDYEAELVVIVGRSGKHISPDDALDHVFGYTCGHDVSARDWQKGSPGGQWLLGKTFDTFGPTGPCMVTTREIPDPSSLAIRLTLNGQTMQDSTTAQLIFDVPTLIAHVSKVVTLRPGDMIFTGTPPGVGAARKPPVFLKPGDVCEVDIEGIGKLANACVAE